MANEDTAYLAWIRSQPCQLCDSTVDVQAHHHTNGTTSPVIPDAGDAEVSSSNTARGKGQRAHDHWAMPLCATCHADLHAFRGRCAHWTHNDRRRWQDAVVFDLRTAQLDTEAF